MRSSAQVSLLAQSPAAQNRVLASLPPEDYARLQPHLQLVSLPAEKVLFQANETIQYAYFINDGLISLRSTVTADGSSIEMASIGNEGVIGLAIILRSSIALFDAVVQLPVTSAWKIRGEVLLSEFDRGGKLHDMLLRATHVLFTQLSQAVICHRFHSSEQRLARSLLVSVDVAKSNTINLTHESIGHLLGTRRTRVTMAARALQKDVLIGYSRGRITILDRAGLERASCECYRVMKNNLEHLNVP